MGKRRSSQDTDRHWIAGHNNLLGVRDGQHGEREKNRPVQGAVESRHIEATHISGSVTAQLWRGPVGHHCPDASATLTRWTEATVLIQKGAPNQLLLGTDVLSNLGFMLMLKTLDGEADLLKEKVPVQREERGLPEKNGPRATSSAGGSTSEATGKSEEGGLPEKSRPRAPSSAGGPTSDATGESLPPCQNTVNSNGSTTGDPCKLQRTGAGANASETKATPTTQTEKDLAQWTLPRSLIGRKWTSTPQIPVTEDG